MGNILAWHHKVFTRFANSFELAMAIPVVIVEPAVPLGRRFGMHDHNARVVVAMDMHMGIPFRVMVGTACQG